MDEATGLSRVWSNPVVRGMLLFSAFRAVYGMGILVVTWLLATSDELARDESALAGSVGRLRGHGSRSEFQPRCRTP